MYCKSCGKEIPDNSIYCSFCGTKQISQNKYIKWNPDRIRNIIFSAITIIRKVWTFCRPFLIKAFIIFIICWGFGNTPLSWYHFFIEDIPEESDADFQAFKKNCISVTKEYWKNGEIEYYQYHLIGNPYDYLHRWEYDDKVFENLYWIEDSHITTKREEVLEDIEYDRKLNIEAILGWILGIYLIIYITKKLVIWTLVFKRWLYKGREKREVENTSIKDSKAWNRYINILTFKTILFTSLIIGGITWIYFIIDTTEKEDLVPYIIAVLLILLGMFIWKKFNKNKKEKS